MINRALVNSPAHLLTAIHESEKINDIDPMNINIDVNAWIVDNRINAAICINKIATIYTRTGIFISPDLLRNLGTVKSKIKRVGPNRNKTHGLNVA